MDNQYFKVTAVFFENIDGKRKKVKEQRLVQTTDCNSASTKVMEKLSEEKKEEIQITDVNQAKYSEIKLDATSGKFFEVKIETTIYDEKSNKEKKQNIVIFIEAEDIEESIQNAKNLYANSSIDYRITGTNETKFVDVI